MKADLDPLLDRLFAAAREEGAGSAAVADLGFETRLMARLREERGESVLAWAFRLCPFFAAITLAAGLWTFGTAAHVHAEGSLLVDAASRIEIDPLTAYLAGDHRDHR